MLKFITRFFILILITGISGVIFLTYFGLETNKFDNLIKSKSSEFDQNIRLDFVKTKIHLNPSELNLVIKLKNPQVLIKNNAIDLSKLDLFLSIKSFFTSDFLLKRAEVAFIKNDIKDLTKITNIFIPRIINKQLTKIFSKGTLQGEFFIPFETDGKIAKDYWFEGKISKAFIKLNKEIGIKNLTAEINHGKGVKDNGFSIAVEEGSFFDLKLNDTIINLIRNKKATKIESKLHTNGKLNFSQIRTISSFMGLDLDDFKDINGDADLKTNIYFNVDKKFKIKNLSYSTIGDISFLEIQTPEKKIIKEYLPEYDTKITLKNTNIRFFKTKSEQSIQLNGEVKVGEKFDNFKIKEKYNYNKKSFNVNGTIDLTNSKVQLSKLNYKKDINQESELNFDVNFIPEKYFNIKKIDFSSGKTKIYLSNVKLNKKFELDNFEKLNIKTFLKEKKNNDFSVAKSKKIIIKGDVFDAYSLLKSLYKKSDRKTFSKKFNSELKINLNKVLTGTNDDVINLAVIASIKDGSYEKLSLKGNFTENEIIEISIYKVDKDKKTLQVVSDRARPFIKNFDFIEGFEGGKLNYESIFTKKGSESNLSITDFKVSKVPALAQLLTLASLQGIADTLSGEGIRFESFEMKSNSKDNFMNIEDALAIGPAVSILLSGYVDKGKLVSLRGTLVPATKLNEIIAKIPVVGDILVGKKSGEGVVGVSFKMKGPPKDMKTTVNPIKTLTPRFIVRAVEKMKRKKQEESK